MQIDCRRDLIARSRAAQGIRSVGRRTNGRALQLLRRRGPMLPLIEVDLPIERDGVSVDLAPVVYVASLEAEAGPMRWS
jgi:hypothetical protein